MIRSTARPHCKHLAPAILSIPTSLARGRRFDLRTRLAPKLGPNPQRRVEPFPSRSQGPTVPAQHRPSLTHLAGRASRLGEAHGWQSMIGGLRRSSRWVAGSDSSKDSARLFVASAPSSLARASARESDHALGHHTYSSSLHSCKRGAREAPPRAASRQESSFCGPTPLRIEA